MAEIMDKVVDGAPSVAAEDYSGQEYVVRARNVKRTYEIGGQPVHA